MQTFGTFPRYIFEVHFRGRPTGRLQGRNPKDKHVTLQGHYLTLLNPKILGENAHVDIVGGLQTYLAQVQTKAAKKEREFDHMIREKEDMQEKIRALETELSVMDAEAGSLRETERVSLGKSKMFKAIPW